MQASGTFTKQHPSEKLQIAIVAPPFYEVPPAGYGGIERVCHTLAEGLHERGHEITLIGIGRRGVRCRFIATRSETRPEGTEQDVDVELLHAARAAEVLDALAPDVVHDHSRAGPLTSATRTAPTVLTVHTSLSGPNTQLPLMEALARRVSLVAISPAQRRNAPHLPWSSTIPNGIHLSEFRFSASKDEFVLYLGRLSFEKGVHLAIDAATSARRQIIIAGTWTVPSEHDYFEREIRPRLGHGIKWLGEVAGDLRRDLLARAHCLLLPAQWAEPFGLVLIEAMASGTPVVGLRAGSLPDIVLHGETGLLCNRPEDLAAAIDAVGSLEPARCRSHVKERFSAERMVERYERLYTALLRSR